MSSDGQVLAAIGIPQAYVSLDGEHERPWCMPIQAAAGSCLWYGYLVGSKMQVTAGCVRH